MVEAGNAAPTGAPGGPEPFDFGRVYLATQDGHVLAFGSSQTSFEG